MLSDSGCANATAGPCLRQTECLYDGGRREAPVARCGSRVARQDADVRSQRPPDRRGRGSENHDRPRAQQGREMARARIVANQGRGSSDHRNKFIGRRRPQNGEFVREDGKLRVVPALQFNRADEEEDTHICLTQTACDIDKAREWPAFRRTAAARVNEHARSIRTPSGSKRVRCGCGVSARTCYAFRQQLPPACPQLLRHA